MLETRICPFWVYVSVISLAVINLFVLTFTRASLEYTAAWPQFIVILVLGSVVCYWKRQLVELHQLPYWRVVLMRLCDGLLFLQVAWMNIRVFNHLTMMAPFPYVDDLLLGWDRLLALPWREYFEFIHSKPFLIALLDASYTSLSTLSLVALVVLCAMKDGRRARFFVEAFFATALICTAVGAAFPAKAAVAMLVPDIASFTNFIYAPGVYHLPHMEALRDIAVPVVLDLYNLPGLVTFPSFHTAAGVLLATAFWRTRLFAPVLVYAIVMIASTPIFGGHYFVDLLVGLLVAASVSAIVATQPIYSGMFGSKELTYPKKIGGARNQKPLLPDRPGVFHLSNQQGPESSGKQA
ncbi:phosphatase PAP2 family protein [Ruegeria marisrubri]|uniref:phosphatase PAP2 family protein n=1 Tax=Ruegeria marisrubri TaxID=1685379 RepID=UPI001969DED2|nr:phosphatase PAP2 family protein [Ruegeria marisrubri]